MGVVGSLLGQVEDEVCHFNVVGWRVNIEYAVAGRHLHRNSQVPVRWVVWSVTRVQDNEEGSWISAAVSITSRLFDSQKAILAFHLTYWHFFAEAIVRMEAAAATLYFILVSNAV